jgi:hypothetical protein
MRDCQIADTSRDGIGASRDADLGRLSITRIDAVPHRASSHFPIRFRGSNKSQILKSFRKSVKASQVVVAVYILDVNCIASAPCAEMARCGRPTAPKSLNDASAWRVKEESAVPKFAWILVPLTLSASPGCAEIFKCVGKNGADLYQNFPCAIDTLGSMPTTAPGAKTSPMPAEPNQAKAKAGSAAGATPPQSQSRQTEPRAGMTTSEVRAIWGEPEETIQDEPVDGRIEIWRYADGRSVQFNNKHRVLAVQR